MCGVYGGYCLVWFVEDIWMDEVILVFEGLVVLMICFVDDWCEIGYSVLCLYEVDFGYGCVIKLLWICV